MDMFAFWLSFWIVGSALVGVIASGRGRSVFGYVLLSLLVSPLIALVLVVALPSLKSGATRIDAPSAATHVRCQACAEWVLPQARLCKHCGSALTPDTAFDQRRAQQAVADRITEAKQNTSFSAALGVAAVLVVLAVLLFGGRLV